MKTNFGVTLVRSLGAVLLLAAVSVAALTSITATYPIPGVDASGNPSALTGIGSGKIYKESRTGIVVGTFVGVVPNQLKASTFFINQGLPLTDPVTQSSLTASSDIEVVMTPTGYLSQASLVLVYAPSGQ